MILIRMVRSFMGFDSSLDRVDGERRGSLPLVSGLHSSMESVSTTSRLANFFSKKGFRSNLKRTKSVTKLDRKQSTPNLTDNNQDSSLISARIRSSRSHESLLTSSHPSMHSINLSDPDVEVKPLHNSVLGQGHCFHVSTSQGSKYVSCTTSEERDKWMYSLRRTARPNEEHSRRSDSSLKLWVVEAKNLPAKKSYYCNILLDRELYAQTSVKAMTDMLFWGEHFEFKSLPVIETVTINLFREADKKKKKDKDLLVGYINLAVADLENRNLIEKWITCNSGTVGKAGKETKSELPIIRCKARKQKVDILPLDAYQPFIKYLSSEYLSVCSMLESVLAVREKEEFATCLVHILQTQGKATQFLSDIIMDEIDRLDDEHLTFRGNSIATKAMEAYMKLVGEKYLQDTLGELIRSLFTATEDCEVDPTKVATPQLLAEQQANLELYCDVAWTKVINSFSYFPNEMREVFASLRSQCAARGKSDYSDNLISGCIFLRFLCPAILYPNLFHLIQEYPQEKASRNLTLIAKTIQTLANFTQFGTKEEFMTFMNKFVEREEERMKTFLHKISSQDAGNEFLQYDGDIDLGKELAVLHCLLLECRDKYEKTLGNKFDDLNEFLNTMTSAFNDPLVGQKKPHRKSQIYDNMVHIPGLNKQQPQLQLQPSSSLPIAIEKQYKLKSQSHHHQHHQQSTPHARFGQSGATNSAANERPVVVPSSPTEVLRDMLRHCGESMDDIPALAATSTTTTTTTDALSKNNQRERASSDLTNRKSKSRSRSYSGDDNNGIGGLNSNTNNATTTTTTNPDHHHQHHHQHQQRGGSRVGGPIITKIRPLVADVSVDASRSGRFSQDRINESWLQMVSAADSQNGDYCDLIPFMDDEVGSHSMEVEANTTIGSSQASIGKASTVGSSGYQSFSHSQSHSTSPIDSSSTSSTSTSTNSHQPADSSRELTKSPVIQYPHAQVQPLAFANPLFGHQSSQQQKHQPHHHHHQQSHHSGAGGGLQHYSTLPSSRQRREGRGGGVGGGVPPSSQPQLHQHFRTSTLKSASTALPSSSTSAGYAGPKPVAPQSAPQQRHARTVQRQSSDSSDDDSGDDESRRHGNRKRSGYKIPLRTTTTVTATTSASTSYQTSIAPLKKLSQLSSSSSDDEDEMSLTSKSTGIAPLGGGIGSSNNPHHPHPSDPSSAFSSSSVNSSSNSSRQYPPPPSSSSSSSTPTNNSSSSNTHFNAAPYTMRNSSSSSLSSSSITQQNNLSSLSSAPSSSSNPSSYQTTFPANTTTTSNNINVAINGYSTFPRKHHRQQDNNNPNNDNTTSPPLPPREAITTSNTSPSSSSSSSSSSSPAVPPKSSSRAAFLQRQFSQQTPSSSSSSSYTNNPNNTGGSSGGGGGVITGGRPAPSLRNFSTTTSGITTNPQGHVQHRHGSTPSLRHATSVEGGKYMTAPRPATRRKPQPQPNPNSVETAISDPVVEIGTYHSSPIHGGQRLAQKTAQISSSSNLIDNNNLVNNNIISNNNTNANFGTTPTGLTTMDQTDNATNTAMTTPAWQVARHMERSSSSHDTTSSSSESSPQALIRSSSHHQQGNNSSSSTTASMQESSSAHSLSSAPLSSSQPWGRTTPSQSDSSSSLSSLSHSHSHQAPPLSLHNNSRGAGPGAVGPVRSDSTGSMGGGGGAMMARSESLSLSENPSSNSMASRIGGGNNGISQFDNGLRHSSFNPSSSTSIIHQAGGSANHPGPPPNSPNNFNFASRLSSRSDGHINTLSSSLSLQHHHNNHQQPHNHHHHSQHRNNATASAFSLASPSSPSSSSSNPLSSSSASGATTPPPANRSLSYHSPTSSPNLSLGGVRSSYPASSRSMDLSVLTQKPSMDSGKRTSVDSLLSQPDDSLSLTGSSRDDLDGRSSSSSSLATNRRLSPQSAVHMGISSVQRKLQEQERTKKEYETEVHTLRQQLLEAQGRLQQAEMRLLDHEVDTHQLMEGWQTRLSASEEKMRKQQEEKDEKMKDIITRLQSIEDELKKEQEEMALAVEQKQQVIEVQEQRIRTLDLANQKLLIALAELKGRAMATQKQKQALNNATSAGGQNNKGGPPDLALEIAGFKTSSC